MAQDELGTLDSFWRLLQTTFRQCELHYLTNNQGLAEQLLIKVQDCQNVLRALLGRIYEVSNHQSIVQDLEYILSALHHHSEHITEWTLLHEQSVITATIPPQAEVNGRGRPSYQICKEDLESLLELGFNFQQIAKIIGVSVRTIRRRREFFGLPIGDHYSSISDDELDRVVADIMQVCWSSVIRAL